MKLITRIIIMSLLSGILISGSCTSKLPAKENVFLKLLELFPESAKDSGAFSFIDYNRIWQANGISLINPQGQKISQEELTEIIIPRLKALSFVGDYYLELGSFYTGFGGTLFYSPLKKASIGYDKTDVEAEINVFNIKRFNPRGKMLFDQDLMVAAIGSYNPQNTAHALDNKKEWPSWALDEYATENYHDIIIYSWGNGNLQHIEGDDTVVLSAPHIDDLARARPFAISEGHLFVGINIEDIKSMIDASLNESRSLADVQEYALAAKASYELGAYGAIIAHEYLAYEGIGMQTPDYLDMYLQELFDNENTKVNKQNNAPKLKKFMTFAAGLGNDEKGNFLTLVIVHENEDEARYNISLLEQQIEMATWVEPMSNNVLYETEIKTEGKVLLAKLYTDMKILPALWFSYQDTILLHES